MPPARNGSIDGYARAVLLSDRVLVMSPRPGRIVADITIDLPRPRTAEMTTSAIFHAFVDRIGTEFGFQREVAPPAGAASDEPFVPLRAVVATR